MAASNDKQVWFRLELTLSREWEEPAAAWLFEQGVEGVQIEDGEEPPGGPARAPTEGIRLSAYFPGEEAAQRAAAAIGESIAPLKYRIESLEDPGWAVAWQDYFVPIKVSTRIIVAPPWHPPDLQPGEFGLLIYPAQAFGTGTHATTRLCLEALDRAVGAPAPSEMLDLGCGSGILAIAALRLGVSKALAVDFDPLCAENTEKNSALNEIDPARLEIRQATVAEVRGAFPLITANLSSKTLLEERQGIIALLKPGGRLFLSGILDEDEEEVRLAYEELNWVETRHEEEWVLLEFTGTSSEAHI